MRIYVLWNFMTDSVSSISLSPFNDNCYYIDLVNENAYDLDLIEFDVHNHSMGDLLPYNLDISHKCVKVEENIYNEFDDALNDIDSNSWVYGYLNIKYVNGVLINQNFEEI